MDKEFENINENEENTPKVTEITEFSETTESENQKEELFTESPEIEADTADETPKKESWKKELLDWIQSLGIAVIAALILVNFVFSFVRVEGQSMEPTLQTHNYLFVFRLGYTPKNGDVVVFKPVGNPKKYYIKRVIATEGQEVNIEDGRVYVDGELLSEDYTQGRTYNVYNAEFPQTVPEGSVFVLGDNRENSRDSRDPIGVGMVKNKSIAGKAMFRLLPLNEIGSIYKK